MEYQVIKENFEMALMKINIMLSICSILEEPEIEVYFFKLCRTLAYISGSRPLGY